MKVLLINPAQCMSLYTFSEVNDITLRPGHLPNLALPTLAALAPEDVEVTLVDENVEPVNYDQHWDIVGITGYISHKKRMIEIADEFRCRGQLVVIGGPYASLSPGTVRPHADVLFMGEAEETWPEFLADFRKGEWKDEYRADDKIDIRSSPVPAMKKLDNDAYMMGVVQTSRGCPFECEFCDVIIYLGRKQRHKAPERVVDELEQLYSLGYRTAFLSDDNFTANRKRAAEIMTAVSAWNHSKPERMQFVTQLSIDIARDRDIGLLDLCADAGLTQAFIGIETPNPEALREVKKHQNLRSDLITDVQRIQSKGIMVQAGMISGFDSDTLDSFRHQYEFVQAAGIPMVSVSVLNAPEGTPLEKRLLDEDRLLIEPMDDLYINTNIIPKRMTREQLFYGMQWLLNKVYQPRAFLDRVAIFAEHLPESRATTAPATRRAAEFWDRIVSAYDGLGPEFRNIPRDAIRLFHRKNIDGISTALVFYKHVVCVIRKWNLWNPALALIDEPDFEHVGASKKFAFSARESV